MKNFKLIGITLSMLLSCGTEKNTNNLDLPDQPKLDKVYSGITSDRESIQREDKVKTISHQNSDNLGGEKREPSNVNEEENIDPASSVGEQTEQNTISNQDDSNGQQTEYVDEFLHVHEQAPSTRDISESVVNAWGILIGNEGAGKSDLFSGICGTEPVYIHSIQPNGTTAINTHTEGLYYWPSLTPEAKFNLIDTPSLGVETRENKLEVACKFYFGIKNKKFDTAFFVLNGSMSPKELLVSFNDANGLICNKKITDCVILINRMDTIINKQYRKEKVDSIIDYFRKIYNKVDFDFIFYGCPYQKEHDPIRYRNYFDKLSIAMYKLMIKRKPLRLDLDKSSFIINDILSRDEHKKWLAMTYLDKEAICVGENLRRYLHSREGEVTDDVRENFYHAAMICLRNTINQVAQKYVANDGEIAWLYKGDIFEMTMMEVLEEQQNELLKIIPVSIKESFLEKIEMWDLVRFWPYAGDIAICWSEIDEVYHREREVYGNNVTKMEVLNKLKSRFKVVGYVFSYNQENKTFIHEFREA